MIIGGLQKFSLLDFPGKISAIVFTNGCNFRCRFCYNPMLVWPENSGKANKIKQESRPGQTVDGFFAFLKSREGKLDAVVITGGEPTIQRDLPAFIKKIKKLGFAVKLDTNGTNPLMLRELVKGKLLDYIAMDIKSGPDKYSEITGVELKLPKIKESVKIIIGSGLPHEFRTTMVPGLLKKQDIAEIGRMIKGADAWYLQDFKSDIELVDSKMEAVDGYSSKEMEAMRKSGAKYVKKCEVR
jgi:pyruvate formate lyase activating enzyme